MKNGKVQEGFILAAGLGTRMRPLTDHIPKPMVEVGGKPMIGHILDALAAQGVRKCAVNTHYHADVLHEYLASVKEPEIRISHEEKLLDTGGGLRNALHHMDGDFYVISGDSFWVDRHGALLEQLADVWEPSKMDILIMLQAVEAMKLTGGVGDYDLMSDGRAIRSLDKSGAYMFTSVRINSKRIFENTPPAGEAFSYLDLLDRAQEAGRLYGLVYDGDWHHISTPQDLAAVNGALK